MRSAKTVRHTGSVKYIVGVKHLLATGLLAAKHLYKEAVLKCADEMLPQMQDVAAYTTVSN